MGPGLYPKVPLLELTLFPMNLFAVSCNTFAILYAQPRDHLQAV
jgi:hypothetical protein